MTNLAIRGHKTRGGEVIKILEMLGGINQFNLEGNTDNWYVLEERGVIRYCEVLLDENVFTIEEFIKKFPYKVGDRVRVPEYESEVCISKMRWDGWEVQYEVITDEPDEAEWYSAKELNEFNEPNEPNKEKKINQMSLVNCDLDEVEIVLGDKFELKIEDGKYYAVKKKSQYPKTYEECCDILNIETNRIIDYDDCLGYRDITQYDTKLLTQLRCLRKIRICRDAYWKLYGEQMGLGKPWEPEKAEIVYAIFYDFYNDAIDVNVFNLYDNVVLCFPTEEMRDTFLENFGYLIEICKELL